GHYFLTFLDPKRGVGWDKFRGPARPMESSSPNGALNAFHRKEIEMTSNQLSDKPSRLFGLRLLVGTIACILLASNSTMAQSTFASLVGTVRDASGAVVAKCA